MYPMTTSLMFELTAYLLVGVFLALYYIHKNKTYFFDQFHLWAYWLILIGNISNLFGLAIFFIYPSARESFAILIMASGILWFLATLFGIRLEKIAFRLMIALFFYLLFLYFGSFIFTVAFPISPIHGDLLVFFIASLFASFVNIYAGVRSEKFSLFAQGSGELFTFAAISLTLFNAEIYVLALSAIAYSLILASYIFIGKEGILKFSMILTTLGLILQGFLIAWLVEITNFVTPSFVEGIIFSISLVLILFCFGVYLDKFITPFEVVDIYYFTFFVLAFLIVISQILRFVYEQIYSSLLSNLLYYLIVTLFLAIILANMIYNIRTNPKHISKRWSTPLVDWLPGVVFISLLLLYLVKILDFYVPIIIYLSFGGLILLSTHYYYSITKIPEQKPLEKLELISYALITFSMLLDYLNTQWNDFILSTFAGFTYVLFWLIYLYVLIRYTTIGTVSNVSVSSNEPSDENIEVIELG